MRTRGFRLARGSRPSVYLVSHFCELTTNEEVLTNVGVWISTLPDMSIDDDLMITILGEPIPRGTVRVSESCECLLEIDAERAWKEMKLSSGWGNEVEVVVTFST